MRSEIAIARLRRLKTVLWFLVGVGFLVGVLRFAMGLGSTTALTDRTPWGFWIGFDILGGVALAAGGFVVAAFVYVFRLEKYHSLLRPAVLTAFLGYGAVVLGLLFDLGRPWNIWRPMFFWQHHSALFEVAWCVMLYFTVLALEFAPVPLESSRFHGLHRILKKVTLPLVVLGIMLSTLHQSSLGTLFLIMPERVHPLWYTELLPLLFFVSAVALGLAMVTVESLGSSWLFDRKPETRALGGLARALTGVLVVFFLIRFADLVARGRIAHLFRDGWESALFLVEVLASVVVPVTLLSIPRVRRSTRGLGTTAGLVVFGIVLNRMNVGGVSGIGATGTRYLPSWQEVSISAAVVAAAILAFLFLVERFRVYESVELPAEAAVPKGHLLRRLTPLLGDARLYSFAFVVGIALALGLQHPLALGSEEPLATPVRPARRVEAVASAWSEAGRPGRELTYFDRDRQPPPPGASPVPVLILDGNRNGQYVLFDHKSHEDRLGGQDGCGACHHMHRPLDRQTPCVDCHQDLYRPTDLFDHRLHADVLGGNDGCAECHRHAGKPKTRRTATACAECHPSLWEKASRISTPEGQADVAPGYLDAMHGMCLKCHEEKDQEARAEVPMLGRCGTCHVEIRDIEPRPSSPVTLEARVR